MLLSFTMYLIKETQHKSNTIQPNIRFNDEKHSMASFKNISMEQIKTSLLPT
jgi:hypothetical protein